MRTASLAPFILSQPCFHNFLYRRISCKGTSTCLGIDYLKLLPFDLLFLNTTRFLIKMFFIIKYAILFLHIISPLYIAKHIIFILTNKIEKTQKYIKDLLRVQLKLHRCLYVLVCYIIFHITHICVLVPNKVLGTRIILWTKIERFVGA